jgi:hypothetical protein
MSRRAGDELADVMVRKDMVLGDLCELSLRMPVEDLPTFLGRLETVKWQAVLRAVPPPPPEPRRERLLRAEDVAELLQISTNAVYRRSHSDLRSVVVNVGQGGRGSLRFDPAALDRFIRARRGR